MTTYVLIHGGGSAAHYWERVVPRLEEAGHRAIAPDLPAADPAADFDDYADAVDRALEGASAPGNDELVVVAQSMGGFTGPVVADRHRRSRLVLVAPMIPLPDETPQTYTQNVDLPSAQRRAAEEGGYDPEFDLKRTFLHDVPSAVVEQLMSQGEPEQAQEIFDRPFPLVAWPDVPTRVIACTSDRMFPLALVQRAARERLGVEPDLLDSGHLPAFGHPVQLADLLLGVS